MGARPVLEKDALTPSYMDRFLVSQRYVDGCLDGHVRGKGIKCGRIP